MRLVECCQQPALPPAPGSLLKLLRRCRKLLQTKLWPNAQTGRAWNQSVRPCQAHCFGRALLWQGVGVLDERSGELQVVERGGEVLLVSQFTLFARTAKKAPDFSKAMPTAEVRRRPI